MKDTLIEIVGLIIFGLIGLSWLFVPNSLINALCLVVGFIILGIVSFCLNPKK